MLTVSHFKQGGLSSEEIHSRFQANGVLSWLQMLLEKVSALGPAGIALATKTIGDVQAGNWLAVIGDIAELVKMIQGAASPAPAV